MKKNQMQSINLTQMSGAHVKVVSLCLRFLKCDIGVNEIHCLWALIASI